MALIWNEANLDNNDFFMLLTTFTIISLCIFCHCSGRYCQYLSALLDWLCPVRNHLVLNWTSSHMLMMIVRASTLFLLNSMLAALSTQSMLRLKIVLVNTCNHNWSLWCSFSNGSIRPGYGTCRLAQVIVVRLFVALMMLTCVLNSRKYHAVNVTFFLLAK